MLPDFLDRWRLKVFEQPEIFQVSAHLLQLPPAHLIRDEEEVASEDRSELAGLNAGDGRSSWLVVQES